MRALIVWRVVFLRWSSLASICVVGCGTDSAIDPPTADGAALPPDGSRDGGPVGHFSFFVTSLNAMREFSGSANGFGGDLRFGRPDGLSGADEICRQIAERSMANNGKT